MEALEHHQHHIWRTQRAGHMVIKQLFQFMQILGPNADMSSICSHVCAEIDLFLCARGS